MSLYDIDEMAEKFEPVRVKFRGTEYVLGADVHSILSASSVFQETIDPEADSKSTTLAVFTQLRAIIRVLSPDLAKVMDDCDLNPAEEAAMLRPVTEVLAQVGQLTFQPTD